MGPNRTRRTLLRSAVVLAGASLGGCLGGESEANDELPHGDQLVLDAGERVPLSNPWHYKERLDTAVEGFDPPVWVVVLADNADFDEDPPADAVVRNFEVKDGTVEPTRGREPTNDIYLAIKSRSGGLLGGGSATLKIIAVTAAYEHDLYFGDELLCNTGEVEPGETFELPP